MAEIDVNKEKWEVSDALQAFYTPYASYVIQTRALPDARDGLKTGARFILYAQYKDKLTIKQKRRKAVATVNAAMRFSPHGDASILGTAVRLSQDFSLRYPIIEVQGNNGSYLTGDDYAQARYLEMRGNEIAYEMTHLLEKNTIDEWKINYTQEEEYPTVLPSKFPFSLVNGSYGIGVACSSSLPPHNIVDVCAAAEKLLLNPNIDFEEIYCPIDFPTGGIIINEDEVKESLKCGNGKAAIVRATIDYHEKERELLVREMPYMTFTTNAIKSISKALDEGKLEGIESVYDGTDYEGCKIFIKLEKGADPEKVKRQLYRYTILQNSFSINQNMLENGLVPKMFGWKEQMQAYLDHFRNVLVKSYEYDLNKIRTRLNIVEGLLICLASIEEVIKVIKNSSSTENAKSILITKFLLNEEQAQSVLNMKLSSIAKLEVQKLEKEKEKLKGEEAKIVNILSSEEKITEEMIKELHNFSKSYGDKRRTVNMNIPREEGGELELPEPEDIIITVSTNNKIKRTPTNKIMRQSRNTKGVAANSELPLLTLKTNTIDILYVFTNKGRMYSLNAGDLEDSDSFIPFGKYIDIGSDETVMAVTAKKRSNDDKYVIFFTKDGFIKKSSMDEYGNTRKKGINAIKLEEGDRIIDVTFANDGDEAMMFTKNGMSIKFALDTVNPIGRLSRGVVGIKMTNDEIVRGIIINPECPYLLITAPTGNTKKVALSEFLTQGRAGKGISANKDGIAGVLNVKGNEDIVVNCGLKSLCIPVSSIPETNRVSVGVKTIKSGKVTSTAIVR